MKEADGGEVALLLSLHPVFAKQVFAGTKTVELRRTRPKVWEGMLVYVYVSAPVKELQGFFEVERVLECSPQQLWDAVGSESGITKDQFDAYYFGKSVAYGICVKNARTLDTPIGLCDLRASWLGFHPPQCYRYVSHCDLAYVHPDTASRPRATRCQG